MLKNISVRVTIWPADSHYGDHRYYGLVLLNDHPHIHTTAWSYSEAVRSIYLKFKMGYAEECFS